MTSKRLWKHSVRFPVMIALALVAICVSAAFSSPSTLAKTQGFTPDHLKYTALRHNNAQVQQFAKQTRTVDTVPFWSSVFNYQGVTYPYQMVGTDPTNGSKTTVVKTAVIALKLVFADGYVFDGTKKIQPTLDSPIFQKAKFTSGDTQYGDAIQRAQFWQYVQQYSKNYHVLLGKPTVSTVTLTVPTQVGSHLKTKKGDEIGLIDINWFDTVLQGIMASQHVSPDTLPIFLDYNTFLYEGTVGNCCILGYHSANSFTQPGGKSAIQTYAFAAYSDPNLFSGTFSTADITALSHEISEWYADPFVDNIVPNWASPLGAQYGCSNILEVGDPVAGIAFTVGKYHPEDEVFFSWFAHQTPSIAIKGSYTYLGTFKAPATVCTPKPAK